MSSSTDAASAPAIDDVADYCRQLAGRARQAGQALASVSGRQREAALGAIAAHLAEAGPTLKQENARDLEAGREAGLSEALLDRLTLTDERIAGMAEGVRQVAAQPDPVGRVLDGRVLPNGIRLQKTRVPIGVVLIIFESRPNVTADAAALCLKSGNAAVLRGGKEARHTNAAIARCVQAGLEEAKIDPATVQLVETTDRAAVTALLQMDELIDLCIPRGGESLIRAVVEQAHIPVIKHYTGNCHLYIDDACDDQMASALALNSKTQRTGVCNAMETLLIHKDAADRGLLKRICEELAEQHVEIRGDARVCCLYPSAKPAEEADWQTEFLDRILAIRVVDSLDEAVDHINRYGSRHTDGIVTSEIETADQFVQRVDTANAFVNCSTRFSDGFQYGLGAEIGISTDKLHARGPMGAEDLTTYKWVAYGNGQLRE